jgi:hypothetical protein
VIPIQWAVPRLSEGGPWTRHGQPTNIYNIESYIFYESQTFPNSSLPQLNGQFSFALLVIMGKNL